MPISETTADQHISAWTTNLAQPVHPYRNHWPNYLFHHAPLENALNIVRSDSIRSRNDSHLEIPRDVAAGDVLASRDEAKNFVRFYFRPGTPTQYHIEGIRATGECKYGDSTHCPFLVMFVFDAKSILTEDGTHFSDGNMQSYGTTVGSDDAFFNSLPFTQIYSVGPCDSDVTRRRCAEVLASSPVTPSTSLKAIVFRSEPEKQTFLYLLGDISAQWSHLCYVSDALKTFEKRYSFVDRVTLTRNGVGFTLNERYDGAKVKVDLALLTPDGQHQHASQTYRNLNGKPPTEGHYWIWENSVPDGEWVVQINVNDEFAYRNMHSLVSELF
ncbi:DarT ssDNA thymidine ADP-ribosyltransferase family protein [Salipiger sp. CCB-MM3]|uniref:DarT ssDNA thymidine ADP-ribosyltransferase family protein n=1 Tax=Salipiger sp. CCB-MM3 TaxID=1792508 RepID=UPI0009F3D4A8|nr:DarT ssDNA thymidine ADP-ribosyltransferase family protein [Salipiger sp. CCB-MM3]